VLMNTRLGSVFGCRMFRIVVVLRRLLARLLVEKSSTPPLRASYTRIKKIESDRINGQRICETTGWSQSPLNGGRSHFRALDLSDECQDKSVNQQRRSATIWDGQEIHQRTIGFFARRKCRGWSRNNLLTGCGLAIVMILAQRVTPVLRP